MPAITTDEGGALVAALQQTADMVAGFAAPD
jgi:hypothetical protein